MHIEISGGKLTHTRCHIEMITMNATALFLVPMARAASPEATHGRGMAIADALLTELGGGNQDP